MLDLLIRGAQVCDGTGAPARQADVAVRAGRIVEPERGEGAKRTLDAGGLALMPGIVDVHTHYDAQATWDPSLSPSVDLGATTLVMGNCGFGIAPCPPAMRETLLRNLSVVEGMDVAALLAGTRWDFESFAGYLDMLQALRPHANLAVLAQHSTIRSAVLGEAASEKRVPSAGEMARLRRAVAEAMDAGAAGFASSWSPNHGGWGGRPMPSTIAEEAELRVLAGVLAEKARGVFVMATGSRATPELMESIAAATGRPAFIVTVLGMYNRAQPGRALELYERCAQANARGREMYVHTTCQPLSFDFTLREPYLLYSHSAFDRVKAASPEDRKSIYAEPAFREELRRNFASPAQGILFYGDWSQVERDGVPVSELAARARKAPLDYVFDLALDVPLVAKLFQNDDRGVAPLLRHPAGVLALSDAGAHLVYFCDAGFGLHFLAKWVRDTGAFTLEEGVRRLTSDPARKYRIPRRGAITPGYHADLVLFDPMTVGVGQLERVKDLPGGGSRMIRKPLGVHGVWVNGAAPSSGPGKVLREFD